MNRFKNWLLELYRGQYYELWITYHNAFGEKETHHFIVTKKIKFTPKHIKFIDNKGREVEIKTQDPIDYMIREYYE